MASHAKRQRLRFCKCGAQLGRYRKLCDKCRDVSLRQKAVRSVTNRRRQLKLQAVEYLGGKCKICKYSKCVAALDFHHRNPKKKDFAVGSVIRSWAKIKKELDKCDLLCANCHREVHAK